MNRLILLGSTLFVGLAVQATQTAHAESKKRGYQDKTVTCESDDNRRRKCSTAFFGKATLVDNLSKTRCVEGENWGKGKGHVWVDRGCRARFADSWSLEGYSEPENNTVRCESDDQRRRKCSTLWRNAVLVRQLSKAPCVEGRSWGARDGSVWVSDGCRAEFGRSRHTGSAPGEGR